ncbi:hypothetical protein J2772_000340 [Chryseobacterium jejuense]|nr:hypothetical protein [Chryseobacterium jejuense]
MFLDLFILFCVIFFNIIILLNIFYYFLFFNVYLIVFWYYFVIFDRVYFLLILSKFDDFSIYVSRTY